MNASRRKPTTLTLGGRRLHVAARGGGGASAEVWCTEDETKARWALKLGRSGDEAGRLASEAERLITVASPLLAEVADAGRLGAEWTLDESRYPVGTPYLLLQWVDGVPLSTFECTPDERESLGLELLAQLAAALVDLHSAGVAHGDLKPENIIVRRGESGVEARLVDLGLATDADLNTPGGGTPRYLAPEVFTPAGTGDGRARDLYALGLSIAEWVVPALQAETDLGRAASALSYPDALDQLLKPLLRDRAGARPSARWALRRALQCLPAAAGRPREDAEAMVRRSYLATRRREWVQAARHTQVEIEVGGAPGRWLEGAVAMARKLCALRGEAGETAPLSIGEARPAERVRWLVHLAGASAARWPLPRVETDQQLVERLLSALVSVPPQCLTLRDLRPGSVPRREWTGSNVELALGLSQSPPDSWAIEVAEGLSEKKAAPLELSMLLARVLRLRGELGRALVVLQQAEHVDADLMAAELERRAGDVAAAKRTLERVRSSASTEPTRRAALSAIEARIALDEGSPERATKLLGNGEPSVFGLETLALAAIARGRFDQAEQALDQAAAYGSSEEENARIVGVRGMLAHSRGDHERALACFRSAAEHAERASALLEEATYLTGVAAAGSNLGYTGIALDAAERSMLLFEHLGRPRAAARAALSRAAVFANLGAADDALEAARDALARAREAGDQLCSAYALLAIVDSLPTEGDERAHHARRANAVLEQSNAADCLRAAARLHTSGVEVDVPAMDNLAVNSELPSDVRLEWWGARASLLSTGSLPGQATRVLSELESLAGERASVCARGEALGHGATLALARADTELARRFNAGAAEAARLLLERAPPEHARLVEALPWVALARPPGDSELLPEQLADVEVLVRALGRRDRLGPLLDQVLDSLVLWTGVERGLLLLRAPGDKLVPRAARNLVRADLSREQLLLSNSLAKRALSEMKPVVAVDAAGDLPELHKSVHALKLRSVLAAPLMAHGRALGVIYLDDRERRGAFGPREIAWVRLVATLASVAISDVRDQLMLRRSVRRAERAEGRLAEQLAQREVELEVAERELAKTRGTRQTRYAYDAIIGESTALNEMLGMVDRVTASDVPLLLVGESGSGKELIARAIHENGPRSKGQFVGENCAAIPEGLLESTLFGHVRGAFTGASRPRAGLFEVASGGTLFLDEIAEMSLAMQTKLLRVLQDGEVRPVGSERAKRVDVRVIGATHRDLSDMVKSGRFREDLFYRLNVISITVPPLRDRLGDVSRLVAHFVKQHSAGRRVVVAPEAMAALEAYSWPGNVRQLENEVRRFLVVADDRVTTAHLSPDVVDNTQGPSGQNLGLNVRSNVDALETQLVRIALERTGGNQTRAARILGLSRFGLQKMMKRLEISPRRGAGRQVASELSDAE